MSQIKRIVVKEVANLNSFSTRSLANKFIDLAESTSEQQVVLDFSGVESVTRSFFDQLRSRKMLSNKNISLTNLSPSLSSMLKIVES